MKMSGTRWHLVPRFLRSHSRVHRTRPETMKMRGTRWHLVPHFRRSHSRVHRTRPETMKMRGTRWHLVPHFRRRTWNDGVAEHRPGRRALAPTGGLHHRHAGRRESPVRLDVIHYGPDQESEC